MGMTSLGNYVVTGELHESAGSTVVRGERRSDGLPVVMKMLRDRHPAPAKVSRLRHELALLRGLEGDGFVKAYELIEDQGYWALILEDFGASSLTKLALPGKLSLEEFLTMALGLADIVHTLHQRRIVHKDINPANVVINRRSGRLALIDFGIATQLPQESTGFISPGMLEGTLAYMSPEQTGRMNRLLDHRTDYYSLGATFYELLTGRLPLASRDPLELVHWLIARKPPSPRELDARIPEPVADIILKLLAKSADDRYQSMRGLQADLQICLDQLRGAGAVAPFPLGRQDRSEHFRLPHRLYGRHEETGRLLAAFERAESKAAAVVVSGQAGIGKSALVQELYRPLTRQRGYFASGKFEQYAGGTPHAAVAQVLQALAQQLLTESEERLATWRERLGAALQQGAGFLVELCPPLERILGQRLAPPAVPPADARNRLHDAVLALLGAFATREHPLCLFFDDLQWADADSLKLLSSIAGALKERPLLLLGAYRDNEVGPAHPLRVTLKEIEEAGVGVEHLALPPLARAELAALVADTLSTSAEAVADLAELLVSRTAGNPFFVRSFLMELHAEGLLAHTPEGWRWDPERLRHKGITENVVDLMIERVTRLSPATRQVLERAACLGSRFEPRTLGLVSEHTGQAVGEALWPAMVEGLVIPLGPVHSAVELVEGGQDVPCRFTHDRVQQAVLGRLEEHERARLHLDVGRRLLAHGGPDVRERRLFDVVAQLNQGRPAIDDPAELDQLAHLNLEASRRALRGGAARQALGYAQAGIALGSERDWEERHAFAWDLHQAALEASFLCSELEGFAALSKTLLARARGTLDEVKVRLLEVQLLYFQQKQVEALRLSVELLRRLGVSLPEAPTAGDGAAAMEAVAALLEDRDPESLVDLPACEEPEAKVALELLGQMPTAATSVMMADMNRVAVCRLVEHSVRHGNGPQSVMGYMFYGYLLVQAGDYERAFKFGNLATALAARAGDKGLLSRVYAYCCGILLCWKQPLYELIPNLVDAYRFAQEAASPYDIGNGAAMLSQVRFFSGGDLRALAAEMQGYRATILQQRMPLVLGWFDPFLQTALNLTEKTPDPTKLAGPIYDEAQRLPESQAANAVPSLFYHHHCKALLLYLFGDAAGAAASAEGVDPFFQLFSGTALATSFAFLRSLYRLGACGPETPGREAVLERVKADLDKLAEWSVYCPRGVEHKLLLVEAERARVQGDAERARVAFERGVELARRSGYQQEEAIAYELAARFFLSQGEHKRARHHLRYAHQAYLRWGALAKARVMEKEHPYLLPRFALASLTTQTLAVTGESQDFQLLDVISVLNASQAISSELELDRLLVQLMKLLLETGGAERGYLLLERKGRWTVEVGKEAGGEEIELLHSVPVEQMEAQERRGLPTSLIHYVARTQESVVLDDATASERFGSDPYIARHQVRSVLCFPLARQGSLLSLVYLENNLAPGAFSRDRLRVLQLLSAQAVISLENAALYDTLEQKVEQRTVELREKNEALAGALTRLREAQSRLILQDRLAALGAMTAGIAHELRNPLNFVNSFSEVSHELLEEIAGDLAALGAQLEPGRAQELRRTLADLGGNLARITEHGRRMENIIRSMLEHSRGAAGEPEELDLNALLSQYVNLTYQSVRSRHPGFSAAIELELDPAVGKVSVMPQELSRVIVNVVENACHAVLARQQGGRWDETPRLRVRSRDLGREVQIAIRDNGVGIAAPLRDKIFNPFFTTKPPGEGTGLGLSISYDAVVKGHGGTIHFESEENAFTEFFITLPRSQAQARLA